MLNKNDPLIGAVQEVMRKNQADRDAVKAVNEKFGVVDRRALPHEQQAHWDAAYKAVLTEGVEALDEMSEKQKKLAKVGNKAGLGGNPNEIDAPDLEGARKGHAKHIEEAGMIPPKGSVKRMIVKAKAGIKSMSASSDKKTADKHFPSNSPNPVDRSINKGITKKAETAKKVYNRLEEAGMIPPKGSVKRMIVKAKAGIKSMSASSDKKFADKYHPAGSSNPVDRDINKGATKKADTAKKVYNRLEEEQLDEVGDTRKGQKLLARVQKRATDRLVKATDSMWTSKSGMTDKDKKTASKYQNVARMADDRRVDEEHLEEKAVSKAQHRFFGLVRGIQKGEAKGSAEATKAAKSMSVKSVRDYAKTKEKGLPEKKD